MQQPHKWFWGLIAVAGLWLLAGMFQTKTIEQDLTARTQAAIASQGMLSPAIAVNGRDVTVSGTRLSDNGAEIVKAADAVNGVRLVRDDTKLIAEASPYNWSLKRDGDQIALSGNIPNPATREGLLSAVGKAFPGVKISDLATYARGKSGDLVSLAQGAYGAIVPLAKGSIDISDGIVSITGEAPTTAAYNAALSAVQALPKASLGKVEILPRLASPFTFNAEKKPNQLVLSGFYPDDKTHADLLAQAKGRFFGVDLVDRTELARGAPKDFLAAAKLGLGQLSRLEEGQLSVVDGSFSLKGVAMFSKAADEIMSTLASLLPKGFSNDSNLTIKQALAENLDASSCQTRMMDVMRNGRILFATGDATVDDVSRGVLDIIVFLASNCPASHITVVGHTDTVGQADANLELSKRRAQAVSDYLVASGITSDRIQISGMGQSSPIASNDTEEGRAMNRRIEFLVN